MSVDISSVFMEKNEAVARETKKLVGYFFPFFLKEFPLRRVSRTASTRPRPAPRLTALHTAQLTALTMGSSPPHCLIASPTWSLTRGSHTPTGSQLAVTQDSLPTDSPTHRFTVPPPRCLIASLPHCLIASLPHCLAASVPPCLSCVLSLTKFEGPTQLTKRRTGI
jgi:hypothetical protein